MERKIGEIFEYNGEWYQCVEQPEKYDKRVCALCAFQGNGNCELDRCSGTYRSDKKFVIFKKLEKVGEPMKIHDRLVLKVKADAYKCMGCCFYSKAKCELTMQECEHYDCGEESKFLEIKQNQEDMEEEREYSEEEFKNNPRFKHHKPIEQVSNMKKLKPFNLEQAKAGKPVCTRNGRKARIICFDRISGDDYYKIVACVTAFDGDFEEVLFYGIDGCIVDSQNPKDYDLMMLPEKKEGWVNVYKDSVYDTKDEALIGRSDIRDYIDTIKVSWEE